MSFDLIHLPERGPTPPPQSAPDPVRRPGPDLDESLAIRPCKRSFWPHWLLAGAGTVVAVLPGTVLGLWIGTPADPAVAATGLDALAGKLDAPLRYAGLAAMGWGLLVGVAYPWLANRYYLTREDVSAVFGIIAKRRCTTRLEHIRRVGVEQSVVGRILGFGNVKFFSAGSGDVDVVLAGVRDPEAVARLARERISTGSSRVA